MFVHYNETQNYVPIKVWLPEKELEDNVLAQTKELAQLPFVFKWVALMPDCHYGYGMPIGGVMAAKNGIVPNAVGMDIGCGMCYIQTDMLYDDLAKVQHDRQPLLKLIVNQVMRDVPVGYNLHRDKQTSDVVDKALIEMANDQSLPGGIELLENAYYQIGTLGGGNHFIEFQQDTEGYIGIMLHSGSRNLGAKICEYFNGVAKELNASWYSNVPENNQLPFLPTSTAEGQAYLKWMNIALDYAYENREKMLEQTMAIFTRLVSKHMNRDVNYSMRINCHHNYAALENHYGENVWVHRKGATRAREGDLGIIPGAMGSSSYLVKGLGNAESFNSSSHGAGRVYSRTKAKAEISVEQVIVDLKEQDVILGKVKKADVAEESRFAYKEIDEVMANQQDLVVPIKKLKTIGVIKG
ncbi:RtcB family protein [Brochothrix thermosphacta]|uniref:3'-phosphate/5'-hydroxy nucleic acid ligase n=1 Tax=Brochothrix thermosphacta TaxID=2756 RepID=A0A2X0RWV4_BROTH|nr:RtcB family protein [Brochothrix thermosphacta]SLM97545.1 Protein RtcB [Brachybacterium faecium]ODJ50112.1 RNA-splicing ligase RtcB [Brochothrix thermosphacta]ODJ57090.1 RNA-splicing ligase RtcB [Brochothrix thermosphacta]ODJ61841.1 RNA-splicing ligase RtcB [Brochothrix thermosphacta]ODJ62553.1 RNA-splicing ligase RtcB [Brochothrix thermosphacta]